MECFFSKRKTSLECYEVVTLPCLPGLLGLVLKVPMFGSSSVGEALGVVVFVCLGAYVHYRVSVRRKQTRLAIGMLEQDDLGVMATLDQLVKKKQIEPLKDYLPAQEATSFISSTRRRQRGETV